jgi:hypothetical protein
MSERESISSLLVLRKLTREIAEAVRTQLQDYLTTLAPLLRPETVFGEHIEGNRREATQRPAQALKELQALYDQISPAQPLNLRRELTPPFPFGGLGVELAPVDYPYTVESSGRPRTILVRRPLTWTLTYTGFAPSRLQAQLDSKVRQPEELQRFILAYLLMHVVTKYQTGLMQVFEALQFPITSITMPEFGNLPITQIGVAIGTERPDDAIVLESAELTGRDSFEEVVKVDEIGRLHSPFRDRLVEMARRHAPDVVVAS